jgi:hypothetical protein
MKMTDSQSLRDLLHRATRRITGISAHAEQPAGHQTRARHGSASPRAVAPQPSLNHRWNHSPARRPRVMTAWQSRIAAFFRREL